MNIIMPLIQNSQEIQGQRNTLNDTTGSNQQTPDWIQEIISFNQQKYFKEKS